MFGNRNKCILYVGVDMKLNKLLESMTNRSRNKTPEHIIKTMDFAANQLKTKKLETFAIKKGDRLPSFELVSGLEGIVKSNELLSKGSLIINFYRGGW